MPKKLLIEKNHLKFDVDVNKILSPHIEKLEDDRDINFYFVLSYPRSDMGKGSVASSLCKLLGDAKIIKFDGLLNTNKDNRHLTTERDDFEIYERENPHLNFSKTNHMLLGDLLVDFIDKYGEGDHISFRPHFAHYFINQIFERWQLLEKPNNLIVEFGGTINDFEVAPFVPYSISFFKKIMRERCKIILITELGFNGEFIKTKVSQDAVQTFASKSISPDYILLREPRELTSISRADRDIFHKEVAKKISDNLNVYIEPEKICSVPFFGPNENKYPEILCKLLKINAMTKLFIGSKNKGKISDWKRYFSYVEIISPYDIDKYTTVPENSFSIFENAKNKAVAWSHVSNLLTVSDDTGFYIPALRGKPGVSVKTFGGELPESRTDKEYIYHLRNRMKDQTDLSCYFESAIAFAKNGVLLYEESYKLHGELILEGIDIDRMEFEEGFPIGSVFKPEGARTVWHNLSDEEKLSYDSSMVECVNNCLKKLLDSQFVLS